MRGRTAAAPAAGLTALLLALGAAPVSAQSPGQAPGADGAELRWWVGADVGLANPTSDLGKVNDSGPLFQISAGRALSHPWGIRATVGHAPLGRGGVPQNVPWPEGPVGPRTDLWMVTAGPSVDLTGPGHEPVDLVWTACAGVVRWESGGSELSEPFTDTDPAGCLRMDAGVALSDRISLATHLSGTLIAGSGGDSNPYETEFLTGFGVGVRARF